MATKTIEEKKWIKVEANDGTWKPEKTGDALEGIYDKYEETKTGKIIYTVVKDDGEIVKVWGSSLLNKHFNQKTGVQIGEEVKIVFLGKKPMMNGTVQRINAESGEPMFYNDFEIFHTKAKHIENKLPAADLFPEEKDIDPKNIPF